MSGARENKDQEIRSNGPMRVSCLMPDVLVSEPKGGFCYPLFPCFKIMLTRTNIFVLNKVKYAHSH
jgi:hypothetical protein